MHEVLAHRTLDLEHPANGGPSASCEVHVERSAVLTPDGGAIGTAHTIGYQLRAGAGRAEGSRRPVTFVFNGGPGVASLWLHLGGVGPFRVPVPTDLSRTASPDLPLEESAGSLLSHSDLVFVDPIGTGFGRVLPEADESSAIGVEGDVAHVGTLIRQWLQRHGRLGDRVFLLGESYGTTRAALLATHLREAQNSVAVEGIALLGQTLNVQETTQRPTNLIGFVAAVPYLAVTASYHGKGAYVGEDPDALAERAHRWATAEYAAALIAGDLLDPEIERKRAEELSAFCGISVEDLLDRRLRLEKEEFRRILLRNEGLVLGLTDSRYTAPRAPEGSRDPEFEAAGMRIDAAFTASISRYLHDALGVPRAEHYVNAVASHERWNYLESSAVHAFGGSPMPSPFAIFDYAAHTRAWMRADHEARLFVGTGHYDALTTVGSAHHMLAQNALPRDRVSNRQYAGGHMMYTDPDSCERLGEDLRAFITGP